MRSIKFILILASLAVVSVNSQCSVCGEGKQVGNPTAEVTLPGSPPLPCSQLQQIGESGQIPVAQCGQLIFFLGPCECMDAGPPTAAPVIVATDAPVRPTGCSVCGEGKEVGAADAIFVFPGQPSVACSVLEEAGKGGAIPLSQCAFLPPIITACECTPIGAPVAPSTPVDPTNAPIVLTDAPVVPPTDEPITPAPIISPPAPVVDGCSVCGDGKKVTAPDAVFVFPGQPSVPCGVLQTAGESGSIPLDQCGFLAGLIPMCECGPAGVTPVTEAPVVSPTNAPVVPPTNAPVVATDAPVSPAPVVPPTNAPVTTRPTDAPIALTNAPIATDAPVIVPPTNAPVIATTDAPISPAPVVATTAPVVLATDAPTVRATGAPAVPPTDEKSGKKGKKVSTKVEKKVKNEKGTKVKCFGGNC